MKDPLLECIRCGERMKKGFSISRGADQVCCIKCYIDYRVEKSIDEILEDKCEDLKRTDAIYLEDL